MTTFLLATEGETDQRVIPEILYEYLGDDDLTIQPLTPLILNKAEMHGGWSELFTYLASPDFRGAFSTPDSIVIVQVDTDVSEEKGFDVSRRSSVDGKALPPYELFEAVKTRLISIIGKQFVNLVKQRIVFAICIGSLECWLLPHFHESEAAKRGKTVNCFKTLDQALKKIGKRSIIDKNPGYYQELSKVAFSKKKDIESAADYQPSLRLFLEQLDQVR